MLNYWSSSSRHHAAEEDAPLAAHDLGATIKRQLTIKLISAVITNVSVFSKEERDVRPKPERASKKVA